MITKVTISKIEDYNNTLIDSNNKVYIKNIEFICDYQPKINDIIYLKEDILNERNLFSFTEINNENNIKEEDLIKVVSENNEYYYIRQYG